MNSLFGMTNDEVIILGIVIALMSSVLTYIVFALAEIVFEKDDAP